MTKLRHLPLLWLVLVCNCKAVPLYFTFHLLWSIKIEDCYVPV